MRKQARQTAGDERVVSRKDPQARFRLREGVRLVGTGMVFDSAWGNFHKVSASAEEALRLLANGATVNDIARGMAPDEESEPSRKYAEVSRFVNDLKALGLVEEVGS